MYEIQKGQPFYRSLTLLRICLLYIGRNDVTNFILGVILRTIALFPMVGSVIHLLMTIKNDVPVNVSEDIVIVTVYLSYIFFSNIFVLYRTQWGQILSDLTNVGKFGIPPMYQEVTRKTNICSYIFMIYCTLGVFIYGSFKLGEARHCEEINKEKGIHQVCGTFTPMWLPEGTELTVLTKAMINVYQATSAFLYCAPAAIICLLAWETGEMLVTKIDHLKSLMQSIFDDEDEEKYFARLRFCIRYHQEIIRLGVNLNGVLKLTIGILSLKAAIILSCMGAQLLQNRSPGAAIHLAGYMVSTFLSCHTGQRIKDQTLSLGDALCASKWYKADMKLMKSIRLVLMRCQRPILIDAVPFGIMSYELFVIILKTSYSYLTLLNNTE